MHLSRVPSHQFVSMHSDARLILQAFTLEAFTQEETLSSRACLQTICMDKIGTSIARLPS